MLQSLNIIDDSFSQLAMFDGSMAKWSVFMRNLQCTRNCHTSDSHQQHQLHKSVFLWTKMKMMLSFTLHCIAIQVWIPLEFRQKFWWNRNVTWPLQVGPTGNPVHISNPLFHFHDILASFSIQFQLCLITSVCFTTFVLCRLSKWHSYAPCTRPWKWTSWVVVSKQ